MFCDQEHLDAIYPYVDLMITDMKSMDTQVHKKYCGAGNEKILVNIKHTVEMGIPLVIRIPVIPDVNNSEENIRATSEFIANELGNHIVQVQLLPYRKMGTENMIPYSWNILWAKIIRCRKEKYGRKIFLNLQLSCSHTVYRQQPVPVQNFRSKRDRKAALPFLARGRCR